MNDYVLEFSPKNSQTRGSNSNCFHNNLIESDGSTCHPLNENGFFPLVITNNRVDPKRRRFATKLMRAVGDSKIPVKKKLAVLFVLAQILQCKQKDSTKKLQEEINMYWRALSDEFFRED